MGNTDSTQTSSRGEIKVYIWLPDDSGRVGHASIELSNGVYISWWPPKAKMDKKKCGKKVTAKKANEHRSMIDSLEDDEEAEGGPPNHTYTISGLDEDEIEEFWEDWSGRGHYELLASNCCTVAYKALVAGGAPTVSFPWVWTPRSFRDYVRSKLL